MRHVLLIAVFLTLAAPPPPAQFGRHIYDVTKYELEIRPDFVSGELRISAAVVVHNPAYEPVLRFGLSTQLEPRRVLVNGRIAVVRSRNGLVEVDAPADTSQVRLQFELYGRNLRSGDEERAVIDENSLFLLWSDRFYPIDFADWASVKTRLLLPRGFKSIAPGRRQATQTTAEGVWHTFEASHPTVAISVFADRRWIRSVRKTRRMDMETLLHPGVNQFAEAIFRTSSDVLAFYTDLHGFYPADGFAFITISNMYARRAFPGVVGYEPAYLQKTMASDAYDGHETALLWWGYAARGEGPGAFQWTEGFGDYVEIMYAQARGKPLPTNLRRQRDTYLAMPRGSDVPLQELRGTTPQPLIHGRLPWMMDAHRKCIGDIPFREAIRRLFEQFRYRTFTLDEFVAAMGGERRIQECSSFVR